MYIQVTAAIVCDRINILGNNGFIFTNHTATIDFKKAFDTTSQE